MPGQTEADKGVLIHMLRALQNFVDSPKKKIVMSSIVAILLIGVKMSQASPPVDVKNMQKEKGKVTSRLINLFRLEVKEMSTDSSGNACLSS
jgi:hypothetical protein